VFGNYCSVQTAHEQTNNSHRSFICYRSVLLHNKMCEQILSLNHHHAALINTASKHIPMKHCDEIGRCETDDMNSNSNGNLIAANLFIVSDDNDLPEKSYPVESIIGIGNY